MVNISLRDKETQGDRRPSHRPVSRAVRDALAHAIRKMAEYDAYIEQTLNNPDAPIDWTEAEYMAGRANDAERELLVARDAALNECSCKPDSDACPVCVAANRQKYGDDIPFGGE